MRIRRFTTYRIGGIRITPGFARKLPTFAAAAWGVWRGRFTRQRRIIYRRYRDASIVSSGQVQGATRWLVCRARGTTADAGFYLSMRNQKWFRYGDDGRNRLLRKASFWPHHSFRSKDDHPAPICPFSHLRRTLIGDNYINLCICRAAVFLPADFWRIGAGRWQATFHCEHCLLTFILYAGDAARFEPTAFRIW